MGIQDRDYMRRRPRDSKSNSGVWIVVGVLLFVFVIFMSSKPDAIPRSEARNAPLILEQTLTEELGTFDVESGVVAVVDPGYDHHAVNAGENAAKINCLKGKWSAFCVIKVFNGNLRLDAELLAYHQSVQSPATLSWKLENSDIGVDTGQAGFFDFKYFKSASIIPEGFKWDTNHNKPADPDDLWYSYCCTMTEGNKPGNTIPFGVVMHSGKGDGSYTLYSSRDAAGNVIALKLVFVNDQGES